MLFSESCSSLLCFFLKNELGRQWKLPKSEPLLIESGLRVPVCSSSFLLWMEFYLFLKGKNYLCFKFVQEVWIFYTFLLICLHLSFLILCLYILFFKCSSYTRISLYRSLNIIMNFCIISFLFCSALYLFSITHLTLSVMHLLMFFQANLLNFHIICPRDFLLWSGKGFLDLWNFFLSVLEISPFFFNCCLCPVFSSFLVNPVKYCLPSLFPVSSTLSDFPF